MRRHLRLIARYRPSRLVRPWALAAPVLVLLIALPLLRPLRYPLIKQMSADEQARFATVQAIVEQKSLAIDKADLGQLMPVARDLKQVRQANGHIYAEQAPTMSALLSGGYWLMHRWGLTFESDAPGVMYLLTLLGVTIPAAAAAGLIYRMGRLFELARPYRALLAAAAVLATGMISYATVLNPHVPAATLILASAACLLHATLPVRRPAAVLWVGGAGLSAALAWAIDPAAFPFLLLLSGVVFAFRWCIRSKVAGFMMYAIAASLPVMLHVSLTVNVHGDFWQGMSVRAPAPAAPVTTAFDTLPDDEDQPASWPRRLGAAVLGAHGLLSHFPVLLLGAIGVAMVMHRHWTRASKTLATATVAGALAMVITFAVARPDWRDWKEAAFAARWFVVFAPLLLFWAGAWLRKEHSRWAWGVAAACLTFSMTASIIGAAAGPLPPAGFDRYTVAAAWNRLVRPAVPSPSTPATTAAVAGG